MTPDRIACCRLMLPKRDLVGGLEHFLFFIIYGIILPIDKYFSRWLKQPTRNGAI
jgi:hypothetical protein